MVFADVEKNGALLFVKWRGLDSRVGLCVVSVYFLFLRSRSSSSSSLSSPVKRRRSSFTSSLSMLISLSRALAFASAIFLSSSISSSKFPRSASNDLICSTVFLMLLMVNLACYRLICCC